MLTLLFISWLLTLAYVILMLVYARGWHLQPEFKVPQGFEPQTKISIIIPARNEEGNIGACINSIMQNDYPSDLYEVIVIDDHSTDRTFDVVNSLQQSHIKCLRLKDYLDEHELLNSYKKKAIETGIRHSTGALIVTTDADCTAPHYWLKNLAAIYETTNPAMIVAPVAFDTNDKVVEQFQSLDFMTMQGITVAAHRLQLGNMSNGANLAFTREAFYAVDGYKGVDHLASGDDYLLMMKIQQQYPGKIACLKSRQAIVHTTPQPDWQSFLQQRIRWASKSGKYDDKKLTGILLLVYLYNCLFLLLFLTGFQDSLFWLLAFGLLLVKTAAELYFLVPVALFFKKKRQLYLFPWLQPLHILYIILAGFLGFVGIYKWKGRKVK